ncbi:hypothetical protein SLA2020_265130 [Shorea laevis]
MPEIVTPLLYTNPKGRGSLRMPLPFVWRGSSAALQRNGLERNLKWPERNSKVARTHSPVLETNVHRQRENKSNNKELRHGLQCQSNMDMNGGSECTISPLAPPLASLAFN